MLGILHRVFRVLDNGAARSLSGKPVIVSYLLQLSEELKKGGEAASNERLTEWGVYELIIRNLMARDFHRAPELDPAERLRFLQRLAVTLSQRSIDSSDEDQFLGLIQQEFATWLRRHSADSREEELQRLFANLRSSATLTRAEGGGRSGWRFSHNSIREFLVAQFVLDHLANDRPLKDEVRITDAMRIFAASRTEVEQHSILAKLASRWPQRTAGDRVGQVFELLWEGLLRVHRSSPDPARASIESVAGAGLGCDNLTISRLSFSSAAVPTNLDRANFASSTLLDVDFSGASCRFVSFAGTMLDGVSFRDCDLRSSGFQAAVLAEVDVAGALLDGADFRGVGEYVSIRDGDGALFSGRAAVGYLAYQGAITDSIPSIAKYRHSSKFDILDKVARKLSEGKPRQVRGLTQRGAARSDPAFARDLVEMLVQEGYARHLSGREELVEVTDLGRRALGRVIALEELPTALEGLIEAYR